MRRSIKNIGTNLFDTRHKLVSYNRVNEIINQALKMKLNVKKLVNVKNHEGNTPLFFADYKTAELLIKHGANVNATNNNGNTPLFQTLDVTVAKLLIENGAAVNASDKFGNTPIFGTTYDITFLLLENGADINAVNKKGRTPVFIRVIDDQYDRVKLLIKHGANINIKDHEGHTLLDYSNNEITKLLLDNLININLVDNEKNNQLHNYYIEYEKAKLLIEHKMNVNQINIFQHTPLYYHKKPEILELLLKNGAFVNAIDLNNSTPLHWHRDNLDVVKLLIKYGADINVVNLDNNTPFATCTNMESFKYMVKNGANIFIKHNGTTYYEYTMTNSKNEEKKKFLQQYVKKLNYDKKKTTKLINDEINTELIQN